MSARTRLSTLLAAAALALVVSRPAAAAVQPKNERIELRPLTPEVTSLQPTRLYVNQRWQIPEFLPEFAPESRRHIDLSLPEIGPESLDLKIRVQRFEFLCGADMTKSAHPFAPRIDCATGECYWWLRGSFDVTDIWTVYVESFQGASAVLGSSTIYPRGIWDGMQIQAGCKYRFNDHFFFEGGPVLYCMSATGREANVGFRCGFTFDF